MTFSKEKKPARKRLHPQKKGEPQPQLLDTPLAKLLRVKDALRTANTPERREFMESLMKEYSKNLGHTKEQAAEFREVLLRKYPYPPLKKESYQ